MKKYTVSFMCLILLECVLIAGNDSKNKKPETYSKINYFNQKNPGLYPEQFAPLVFSTGKEFGAVYSPAGDEIYFSMLDSKNVRWQIMFMQFRENAWSEPKVASFSGKFNEANPCFSPDGKRIYYCSNRSKDKETTNADNYDVWYVERSGENWGIPVNAGSPVNTPYYEDYPSIAKDGTLYFISNRPDGKGEYDIYYAKYEKGKYIPAENAGDAINTAANDFDPLALGDDCLLFVSDRSGGYGKRDLYISRLKEKKLWTQPQNLSVNINTDASEYGPKISPDDKYLFFTRSNTDNGRKIYWLDIKALHYPAITQPVYNYIEAWYEGKGERMKLALHPQLSKRRIVSEEEIWDVTAEQMYQLTNNCRGCVEDPEKARKEIFILDQSGDIASLKVISNDFIDYLHLAKFNERWIIVNVLWDYIQTEEGGTAEGIEQAAQSYFKNRNNGGVEKMSKLLYSKFVTRRALSLSEVDHDDFVSFLGKIKTKPVDDANFKEESKINILDVDKKTASVKISSGDRVEYLHLAFVEGRWKIVNSLRDFQFN